MATTPNDATNGSTLPEILQEALSGWLARGAGGSVTTAPTAANPNPAVWNNYQRPSSSVTGSTMVTATPAAVASTAVVVPIIPLSLLH